MFVECDDSLFPIALFLAFFEKNINNNLGNTMTIHEQNWRLTSVVMKQKMNFVVVKRIELTILNQLALFMV